MWEGKDHAKLPSLSFKRRKQSTKEKIYEPEISRRERINKRSEIHLHGLHVNWFTKFVAHYLVLKIYVFVEESYSF